LKDGQRSQRMRNHDGVANDASLPWCACGVEPYRVRPILADTVDRLRADLMVKMRVGVVNPGLTYDLRHVSLEDLDAAIEAINAPDPLFLMLIPEQRTFIRGPVANNRA